MKKVEIEYYTSKGEKINKDKLDGLVLEATNVAYQIDNPSELEKVYREVPKKERGPFGDIWQVGGNLATLVHKAYPKPAEAADLGIVIKTTDNHYYFVGITRKNDPGKGKAAFIGGFCSKPKYDYEDSGMGTAIKEGREEVGLEAVGGEEALEKIIHDYSIESFPIRIKFGDKEYETKIEKVKTIKTSDLPIEEGGERLPDGKIRVDKTTLYVIYIKANIESKDFDKAFKQTFKEGDDAKGVVYWDITKNLKDNTEIEGGFGIKHHKVLWHLMLEFIRNNYIKKY